MAVPENNKTGVNMTDKTTHTMTRENTKENRTTLASMLVSIMDTDRVKTLLAMKYIEELEDQENFDEVFKALEGKGIISQQ